MEFRAGPLTGPGGSVPPKSMEGALWEAICGRRLHRRPTPTDDSGSAMQSPPTNRLPQGHTSAAGHSAAQQYARQSCTAGRRKAFLVLFLTGCREDGHSARVFSCPAEGPAGTARKHRPLGRGPCSRGADHGRRPGSVLAPAARENLGKDAMKRPSHITTYAPGDRPIAAGAPNRLRSENNSSGAEHEHRGRAAGRNPPSPNGLQHEAIPRGMRAETGTSGRKFPRPGWVKTRPRAGASTGNVPCRTQPLPSRLRTAPLGTMPENRCSTAGKVRPKVAYCRLCGGLVSRNLGLFRRRCRP